MSGQIFQPNLTSQGSDGGSQSGWQYDPEACHRPAADFGVPIICTVGGSLVGKILNYTIEGDIWTEFEAFSKCCPKEQPLGVTNIYSSVRHCQDSACFTSEESVARGFGECVARQGELVIAKFERDGRVNKNATTKYRPGSRCEYIDYTNLKKGIQGSKRSSANRVQSQKVFSTNMIFGLVLGMVVVAGAIY